MFIADFTMDHPIFREPIQQVPDIEVKWEQTFGESDGPTRMIAWVESDDFDAVDAAIDDDPTVADPTVITEMDGRRLYRVDFTDLGRETHLLPEIIERGGVFKSAMGTNEGWRCEVRLPDREAFQEVYRFGQAQDVTFTFHQLFEETAWVDDDLGLTDAQRETLTEAVESGYLAVPRECSIEELGERLGISQTAASERFRRGAGNLIDQTLS